MFAFVLIGLFFAVCTLFLGLLALCSRIGSFLSSGLCSVALFFQTLTAALMTYVLANGPEKPAPDHLGGNRMLILAFRQ